MAALSALLFLAGCWLLVTEHYLAAGLVLILSYAVPLTPPRRR